MTAHTMTFERHTEGNYDTITIVVDGDQVHRRFLTNGKQTSEDHDTAEGLRAYLTGIETDGFRVMAGRLQRQMILMDPPDDMDPMIARTAEAMIAAEQRERGYLPNLTD